ncbi:MAG: metallophosphoesterase family protein [Solirubrobacterales bacterium]
MRYGVISDVHANLHALEAVLAALAREDVDRIVCAGDVVGYGPRPNECVARIASLEPPAVVAAGNHDLMAVGRLPTLDLGPLPRQTLEWTWNVLEKDARSFLEGLPATAATDDGVVVAHGSLDDPAQYVLDAAAAAEQLRLLGERHPRAQVLVLGHTHRPFAFPGLERRLESDPWLLNAGSVGQSRERKAVARAAVLELDRREARFLTIDYDIRATKRELRTAGLPEHACHLAPGLLPRLRRRLLE